MKLQDYLYDKGLKKYKFAEITGISLRTISKACHGYKLNLCMAKTIEIFTDGKVRAVDICREQDNIEEEKA